MGNIKHWRNPSTAKLASSHRKTARAKE